MAHSDLTAALRTVSSRISQVCKELGRPAAQLVAVSKTKPADMVQQLYDVGHRHFGENYVQELIDKAPMLPGDIRWHFIGHLQSNKCSKLVQERELRVFVQVNTSGEDQKSGISPSECVELARYIHEDCSQLQLAGLMTIGKYDETADRFFELLRRCRSDIAIALGLEEETLELSMGMSADYELALKHGSTNVRVGSTIFGARDYPASKPATATTTEATLTADGRAK